MAKIYTSEVLMTRARIRLLKSNPFFGHLAMNLELVESELVAIAGTNGRQIIYNPESVQKLAEENELCVDFLVAHEVLHCVFDHVSNTRIRDRHPTIWNIAADYVINGELSQNGFTLPKTSIKVLHEKKYYDMFAEKVYDLLLEKADENGGGGGAGSEQGTFDDHSQWGQGKTEKEKEELEDFWKSSLASAARMASSKLSGNLKRIVDQLLNPKVDWKQVLRNCFTEKVKADYSWIKPNRRFFGQGIALPSMEKNEKLEIAVAIDVSGSTYNDIPAFMTELKNICNSFDQFKVHISLFDTEVKEEAVLENDEDFDNYLTKIVSGGGTDFICWWDWYNSNEDAKRAKAVIFMTDGYPCGEWINGPAPKNLFWLIKGSDIKAPVGMTLSYDEI